MEDEHRNAVVIRGRGQGANSQRKRGVGAGNTHTHRMLVIQKLVRHTHTQHGVKIAQSRPDFWDPMDTVHGILQARILEWIAFPVSRASSQPRDRTLVSRIAGRFFTS